MSDYDHYDDDEEHHAASGVIERPLLPIAEMGRKRSQSSVAARESDPDLETAVQRKRRWNSIKSVYFTNFLNAVSFSICLSTMWQYLELVGGSKAFLGIVVGAFSLGQLVGAPYWGYWANNGKYRPIFFLTSAIKMIGNLMYIFSAAVPGNRPFFMAEARLLVGIGAGNMALCNAYVSQATTLKERTGAIGGLAASGGVGFLLGPMIGIAFGGLKPGFTLGSLTIDYLRGPAECAFIFEMLNIIGMLVWFQEMKFGEAVSTSALGPEEAEHVEPRPSKKRRNQDSTAALAMLVVYFGVMIVLSVAETLSTALTMDEYAWNAQKADVYGGVLAGLLGVVAVILFLLVKKIALRYGERRTLVFGIICIITGTFLYIPWGPGYPKLWVPSDDDDTQTSEGCKDSWCTTVPKLPFEQFLSAIVVIGIGYPVANVMVFSIYTKLLGPGRQGVWMGLLVGAGSMARTIGPLVTTSVYANYGPRITYFVVEGFLSISLTLILVFYRRLVPNFRQDSATFTIAK